MFSPNTRPYASSLMRCAAENYRDIETISIENRFDTNTISRYSYNNDAGGRRVSVIQTGSAFEPVGAMFNLYRYNSRSELTSAERYFGSNTNDTSSPVGLQDWSYAFDNIGNRTGTMKANAAANYTANALNQYTERSVPNSSDIIGSAETNVTVTVNEEEADRQGYYWSHRLTVDNLFNPIYTQVVVEAICDQGTNDPFIASSETGNVFVAESPESFTYDDDGNLLSDGRFEYQWDCENRLIAATTKDGLPEDMPIVHVEFQYDYMSRRVGKTVYEYDTGVTNWTQTDARTFLYDSWNVIQEVSIQDSDVSTNHYVWGIDLSGSLQGAGGIGGLLASYSSGGTSATSSVFTFDGNGNVSELISTNGTIAAHYEYSSFGETIVRTGGLADENPFRFSTKYFDDETGLAYYGYRYYSPPTGKWISDDPLLDLGSVPAMAIRKHLLGMLVQRFKSQILLVMDERLSGDERAIALVEAFATASLSESISYNQPEVWLLRAGNNWLLFCGNNPVNFIDSLGLYKLTEAEFRMHAEMVYDQLQARASVIDAFYDAGALWTAAASVIAVNLDQMTFDTPFITFTKRDNDPVTYRGKTYRSGDVNYFAQGMYEEWQNRSLFIGYFRVYGWKLLFKPFRWPRQSELYWHDRGREIYREIEESRSGMKSSHIECP